MPPVLTTVQPIQSTTDTLALASHRVGWLLPAGLLLVLLALGRWSQLPTNLVPTAASQASRATSKPTASRAASSKPAHLIPGIAPVAAL